MAFDIEMIKAHYESLPAKVEKIKNDAKNNKCTVFHQFCENEFAEKSKKFSN